MRPKLAENLSKILESVELNIFHFQKAIDMPHKSECAIKSIEEELVKLDELKYHLEAAIEICEEN